MLRSAGALAEVTGCRRKCAGVARKVDCCVIHTTFCPSWVVSDRIASTVRRSRLLAPLRGSTTRRFFFVTFALSSVLAAPLRMTRNAVLCVRYTVFIRLR